MVRLSLAAAALAVLLGVPFAGASTVGVRAAEPAGGPTFAIRGRGWGHGVGMSQYGARGFAERGATYSQILAHYYPGTALGRAPVARVRVLLAERKKALRVGSARPYKVRDGEGTVHQLEAGLVSLGPGLKLTLGDDGPRSLPGPLLFTPGGAPLELNGKRYRGSIELTVEDERLSAVNSVALEAYLAGVVPDEMPPDWAPEALKAQAVVARSYALAVRKSGPFDLFADVRSQVYGGVDAEEPTTSAAVQSTAGEVLLYDGKIATTYFFSTSGGRTADIADVWENAEPTPYLVSVPDPYDSISPLHTWGPVVVSAAKVAKAFRIAPPILDVRVSVNASRRVGELVVVNAKGETPVPAATVREKLGLRSTWFRVAVLALARPAKPIVFGSRTELSGIARGLTRVGLEQRVAPGAWEPAVAVKPAKGGTVSLRVKPLQTTWYRLVSGDVRSGPVRIAVAPRVRLAPPKAPTGLAGTVKPALEGATVVVQRQTDTGWTAVAKATVDARGGFEAPFPLDPGSYRARVAPGRGFVAGISPVLNVVPA